MKPFFFFFEKVLCGNLSLGNGIIRNRAVGIHMSEFRLENEILGQIKT